MKTEAEVRTFYNVTWLRRRPGFDRYSHILVLVKIANKSDPRALAWLEPVWFNLCEDPCAGWDDSKPRPVAASSWQMCKDDGLVTWYERDDHWAILLTERGKELTR